MPLPLAHALVGASISVALWPAQTPEQTPSGMRRTLVTALVTGALLGMCADADYSLSRLRLLGWGWHHGFTHSVAFAVIIGAAAAWAVGARGWRGVAACVLAALSHPVLDYVITESRGVALWWPVTDQRYKLGIDALSYYRIADASKGALALAELCLVELALFAPLLALAVRARRRR